MTTLNPDLSKPTCRVCLQNSQYAQMSSIFDMDGDFCDLYIYEKIEKCAGIKVLQHEKLPTLICSDCYGILKVSYKFRIICQNSNEYLKEFVAVGPKLEISDQKNPLLISEWASKKNNASSQYKTRLKDRSMPSKQNIKNEIIDENFADGDSNVSWLANTCKNDDDIRFSENILFTTENIDLDIRNEKVEPNGTKDLKPKKKSNTNLKTHNITPMKFLEITSDGAAIIREKKPCSSKERKEKQPNICEVCGNIYQRRYALELHMRRHRAEKPHKCEICGNAFHSNFELIRHMRKHTGSRPYKCSFCSRAFGDQSTLIKHERIHRNERPFKCDTCGKTFTYSNVLKHHKLTHTGEKPYTCELCGKCFTRPHHLRAHLETLLHQNDPRSKDLLQNIRKNNDGAAENKLVV